IALALLGMSLAGAYLVKLLFLRLGTVIFPLSMHEPVRFMTFLSNFLNAGSDQPIVYFFLLLHMIMGVWLLRSLWLGDRVTELEPAMGKRGLLLFFTLTMVLSPVANLGAVFVKGTQEAGTFTRYTFACWWLPPLCLGAWFFFNIADVA